MRDYLVYLQKYISSVFADNNSSTSAYTDLHIVSREDVINVLVYSGVRAMSNLGRRPVCVKKSRER